MERTKYYEPFDKRITFTIPNSMYKDTQKLCNIKGMRISSMIRLLLNAEINQYREQIDNLKDIDFMEKQDQEHENDRSKKM